MLEYIQWRRRIAEPSELEELAAAEKIYNEFLGTRPRATIQQHILAALAHGDAVSATTVLNCVRRVRPDISRESLAPQLSRLAQAGAIRHERKMWRLA